ncbi:MAG TPA: hypothetical protein VMT20_03555 [Terriglobia bacterium]|nr:hypothetical protein [Terriglobia bacterium]
MAEQKGDQRISRTDVIHQYREAKVARFQELVNQDRFLAAQAVLDPLGTLSRFGLVDESDHDLHTELSKGSLADLAYFKHSVETRGLENVLGSKGEEIARALRLVIVITITWDHVRVVITITF